MIDDLVFGMKMSVIDTNIIIALFILLTVIFISLVTNFFTRNNDIITVVIIVGLALAFCVGMGIVEPDEKDPHMVLIGDSVLIREVFEDAERDGSSVIFRITLADKESE